MTEARKQEAATAAALDADSRIRAAARPVPELPIGLIALDLDGTLIGDDLVLGERTIRAIRRARERGVVVSIVTGRMTTSALPYARTLGLTDPLVAFQGRSGTRDWAGSWLTGRSPPMRHATSSPGQRASGSSRT
jgi:phosphatidylserine/phosphatidylglycerophosphate/cardiolipin synthase-like enzyme